MKNEVAKATRKITESTAESKARKLPKDAKRKLKAQEAPDKRLKAETQEAQLRATDGGGAYIAAQGKTKSRGKKTKVQKGDALGAPWHD